MKLANKIMTGSLAIMAVLFLDACSKTKNSTPTTNNGQQAICTTGSYMATNGQTVPCQIGSTINTGFVNPNGWTGGTYPQGVSSCQDFSNYYRVQYVPVRNGGVIDCVRYDVLAQYAGGSSYANYGPEFYYAYPPEVYDYAYGGSQYSASLNFWVSFN